MQKVAIEFWFFFNSRLNLHCMQYFYNIKIILIFSFCVTSILLKFYKHIKVNIRVIIAEFGLNILKNKEVISIVKSSYTAHTVNKNMLHMGGLKNVMVRILPHFLPPLVTQLTLLTVSLPWRERVKVSYHNSQDK